MAAAIMLAVTTCACSAQVVGGSSRAITNFSTINDFAVPVASVQDRRFAGVERQQFDFSCGSAALATLLRHHYDYDVRESNAFRGMWAHGDTDQIRKVGFSLLDMKRWLASRGIKADGYKVSLDQVQQVGIPGIALITIRNYRHFVVVKGVRRDEVLLGDPASGLIVVPRAQFQASWNGIFFVLAGDQSIGKQHFNQMAQWAGYARAPVGTRFADPVSQQALMLTAPFYGDIS